MNKDEKPKYLTITYNASMTVDLDKLKIEPGEIVDIYLQGTVLSVLFKKSNDYKHYELREKAEIDYLEHDKCFVRNHEYSMLRPQSIVPKCPNFNVLDLHHYRQGRRAFIKQ